MVMDETHPARIMNNTEEEGKRGRHTESERVRETGRERKRQRGRE